MNYQKVYDQIIQRAKLRGLDKKKLEGYFEKHHIIPRCLGGLNEDSNYVLLTAREHFICHQLLWKTNKENNKLFYVFKAMSQMKTLKTFDRYVLMTSKQFAIIKEAQRNFMIGIPRSEETKEKISLSNIGKKLSEEHKQKLRGRPSWNKGIPMSQDTKDKILSKGKIRIYGNVSLETKMKISNSKVGKPAWCKGLHLTDEHKRKIADARRGISTNIGNVFGSKKCYVNYLEFNSVKSAGEYCKKTFGFGLKGLYNRFKSDAYEGWHTI